jgi:ParB-like chromosome segregation protein Spo0J
MNKQEIIDTAKNLFSLLEDFALEERINIINEIKIALHEFSPHKNEPVDCVIWVKTDLVHANNYNPNNVASVEFSLLKTSIENDRFTQPVVTMPLSDGDINSINRETIDGYHRGKVAKEDGPIRDSLFGYVPVVTINKDRNDLSDRMAATIRHNRARGKHSVNAMSEIVVELKRRNWNDEKISKHLGMDADEVLRLSQISGLAEMFTNRDFSEAWESNGKIDSDDNVIIED